jgi:IS5 family transposase
MHQPKKGEHWHFGTKAHIGADAHSGLAHGLRRTPAKVANVTVTAQLLHDEDTVVLADAGYTGAEKRAELQECKAT